MIYITSSNLRNKIGRAEDSALTQPVVITKHGEPRLVLISYPEYERLKRRDRQVLNTADLDRETIEAIAAAEPPAESQQFDEEVD